MPRDAEHRSRIDRYVRLHGRRIRCRWRLPHLPSCEADDEALALRIEPAAALGIDEDQFTTILTTVRATTEERSVFSLERSGGGPSTVDRLCWDRLLDVCISADRVDCRVLPGADRHEVEARLLGPATAYWLERSGHLALHASALALDDRAVVVAGPSGAGKSTFAAAAGSVGAPILADDLCGVHVDGGHPVVYAGPRWIRLDPTIARRFGLSFPRRARCRRGKVRVFLGTCAPKARSVAAVLLLAQRRGSSSHLERLAPADAFPHLQGASYVGPDVARPAGLEASRFLALTKLLDEVPVFQLALPASLDKAPRAVAETLDRLPPDVDT